MKLAVRQGGIRRTLFPLAIAAIALFGAQVVAADLLVLDVDGEGSVQEWTYAGGAGNFTNVQTDDGDTSYVFAGASNIDRTWSVTNSSGQTGTITNVTVHGILRVQGGNERIKLGVNTTFMPTGLTLTDTYAEYSNSWATNPTGGNWTWADIDALEIGMRSQNNGQWAGDVRGTRIWVVVDYTPPAGNVTTLGDGSDPVATTVCPGDPEEVANEFTFATDGNTDAVNDLTVTLSPAGSFDNLSQVRITSQGGGTEYGVVSNPATETLLISLTNLDATAGGATFEVRITPKTHAGMDAPPGASYDITAPVTAFTPATNTTAGSDNDTEATTVDNASPTVPTWGTITPGNNQITLAWTDPADVDFQEVIIVRRQGGAVTGAPTEGSTYSVGQFIDSPTNLEEVVFVGTDAQSPWIDSGVTNDLAYHYRIFARDNPCVNWSEATGSDTGPHTPKAVTTYRWQVQQSGAIGTSGYTANWPAACGGTPDEDNNLNPFVTTMSTDPFCGDDHFRNGRPAGPHQLFLMIKDTAYATATTVTGQATGNRWTLEDQGGGGKTFRFTLGYAQGGTFTSWGFVDVVVPDSANELYAPDMSGISGTAPSGSHLALLVTKQTGGSNDDIIVHFADDRQPGDQSGEITVSEVVAGNTTTLGDGSDPAPQSVCPGSGEVVANEFTFVTDGNTDAVDDVTVTLAPSGGFDNLSQVRITDSGGGQQFGVVNGPAADSLVVGLTGLDATTSPATYEVRLTPKSHAAMPLPPGATFDLTAPITAFSPATNNAAGSDDDTEATTVDNASPGNPAWGSIIEGDNQIELSWTDPADSDFGEVMIVRRQNGSVTGTPVEGQTYSVSDTLDPGDVVVFVGNDASSPWTDTGVANTEVYHYRIFARDNPCANWSTGNPTGPHTPQAPVNEVTPGVPTASSVLCDSVTIEAPFTGDVNNNSTTTFGRKAGSVCTGGGYAPLAACTDLGGASPRTCVDTTAAEQTEYCYEVTFSDGDGVLGSNPQTVGPLTTPPCATDGTLVSATAAVASSCNQITVTSYFSGDDNGTAQTQVEYDDGGGFQVGCAIQSGPSPHQCILPGLSPSTSHAIRVTFTDTDGVTPDNNLTPTTEQVTPPESPVGTPSCGADDAAPTVLFLAPARDAVLGGTDRVKVQVFDSGGLPASPLLWSVDGDALATCPAPYCSAAVNVNTNYGCDWAGDNTCEVYQFDLDTTTLTNGDHYLTVQVTDSAGNVARLERPFQARNDLTASTPGGSGQLLRRTFGSQVCRDCHNLATHSSQLTDTGYGNWAMECLTCHTPHGVANIFLIREVIETPNSGPLAVRFENTTGAVADSSAPGSASYVNEDHTTQTDGICQVCHTRTGGGTPRWRNKDQASPNLASHYTTGVGTQPCTDCHTHAGGFTGGGGGCTGCHFTGGQAVTAGRRPVDLDFSKQSHHAGNGGVAMGGTLTDFDCVVCHAEGEIQAGATATTAYHNDTACNGGRPCIDLKNADDATGTPFSYDKQLLTDTLATVNDWSTGSVDWENETSTALDPFCLTCHDSDGATDSANQNQDEGCSATASDNYLNPFCDQAVTNDYDRVDRTRVTDIRSKVTAGSLDWGGLCLGGTNDWGACSATGGECTGGGTCVDPGSCSAASDNPNDLCRVDADCPGGACTNPSGRLGDGILDPPEGIYARHAIRGTEGSLSVYTTQQIPNAYWNQANFAWNDTSQMGCADCHTVDGANTTAGNAHGSDSEYLLKNAAGLALEGDYQNDPTLADFTYICYRCHDWERYSRGQIRDHTDNDGDWAHTSDQVGGARSTTGNDGSIFGLACTNCHGGAPGNPLDIVGFGAIHGTSESFGVGNGGGTNTRLAYRFTNGASLRYFDPNGWNVTDFSCWTLGSADNWGACTQHGNGSRTYQRAFNRPLSY